MSYVILSIYNIIQACVCCWLPCRLTSVHDIGSIYHLYCANLQLWYWTTHVGIHTLKHVFFCVQFILHMQVIHACMDGIFLYNCRVMVILAVVTTTIHIPLVVFLFATLVVCTLVNMAIATDYYMSHDCMMCMPSPHVQIYADVCISIYSLDDGRICLEAMKNVRLI